MSTQKKHEVAWWPDLALYVLYIVLFASMICCWRAITSICVALLLLTGLLKNKWETGRWLNRKMYNPLVIACAFFYFLQVSTLLYSTNLQEGLRSLQIKSGILFIPFAVCCCNYLNALVRQGLMQYYICIMAVALLYCLGLATAAYTSGKTDNHVFFYHALVSPFQQHAVQFSILVFIALLYLLEMAANKQIFYKSVVHGGMIVFFTVCMFLLSSKLLISCTVFCLVYYAVRVATAVRPHRTVVFTFLFAVAVSTSLVSVTQNPISHRFREILSGNLRLVGQSRFNASIYFNGLQFRLLEWRFTGEILSEQRAWLTGVGNAAQPLLDKKYTSTGMYTGGPNTTDKGYLSYNTHNQFLQSLLQCGIPGLLAFIGICCAMVWLALVRKRIALTFVTFLLIAYAFNEAVFENQYGLTLFILWPLFIFYGSEPLPAPEMVLQRKSLLNAAAAHS